MECSILKFVDEVVEGESKENPPYWAGIDRITEILDKLSKKVKEMKSDTESKLIDQKNLIDAKKQTFEQNLDSGSDAINYQCQATDTPPSKDYFEEYDSKK